MYHPSFKCKISLQSCHNKYVCSQEEHMIANRDKIGDWEQFTAIPLDNGRCVAFQSHFGKYLSAQPNGNLEGNRKEIKEWERFILIPIEYHSHKFAIQSEAHKKYLSAQPNGNLEINRDKIGDWEKFTLILHLILEKPQHSYHTNEELEVSIFSVAHKKYLCNDDHNHPYINRKECKDWEKFISIPIDGKFNSKIVLKTAWNKKYLSAQPNGKLEGNRDKIGDWEKFRVIYLYNNEYAIQSVAHNKYLSAQPDGNIEINRDKIGDWEKFNISVYGHHGHHPHHPHHPHMNDDQKQQHPFQPDSNEFTKPYLFLKQNLVQIKACSVPNGFLRCQPNNQSMLDHNGGKGHFAQWDAYPEHNGKLVRFKNRKTGQYLRIHHIQNKTMLDCAGMGGKFCFFIVHKQHNDEHTVQFESNEQKGQYIACDHNGPRTGIGGVFCNFKVFREN